MSVLSIAAAVAVPSTAAASDQALNSIAAPPCSVADPNDNASSPVSVVTASCAAIASSASEDAVLDASADHAAQDVAQAASASGGHDSAVCPACLGVLQALEGSLKAAPSAMLAGLPEAEGNAGSWQTCTAGSVECLSQCVRYTAELCSSASLACQLRPQS